MARARKLMVPPGRFISLSVEGTGASAVLARPAVSAL
jgi:hypothetical protein